MVHVDSEQPLNTGQIIFVPGFPSEWVLARNIVVWLPPGYESETNRRYSVLYAHDGQNLFDPHTAFAGVDWGLDQTLSRLLALEEIRQTLVVGVWNTPQRYREYDPQQVFERYLSHDEQDAYLLEYGRPLSDRYLQFLVEELKPFIDREYRTLPGRGDTFLLGSSMGGLISLYGLCEYPEVFGGAGCLSTHWPAAGGKMAAYLTDHLPCPQSHRLYFDFGTETIDAQYEPYQLQVDQVLQNRGYQAESNWMTRKYFGEDHSEYAWRRRLHIPLRFLLTP